MSLRLWNQRDEGVQKNHHAQGSENASTLFDPANSFLGATFTEARSWPSPRVFLKEGGGSKGGGWVGLWGGTPPPGDPELLEAPKASKKFFDLN